MQLEWSSLTVSTRTCELCEEIPARIIPQELGWAGKQGRLNLDVPLTQAFFFFSGRHAAEGYLET